MMQVGSLFAMGADVEPRRIKLGLACTCRCVSVPASLDARLAGSAPLGQLLRSEHAPMERARSICKRAKLRREIVNSAGSANDLHPLGPFLYCTFLSSSLSNTIHNARWPLLRRYRTMRRPCSSLRRPNPALQNPLDKRVPQRRRQSPSICPPSIKPNSSLLCASFPPDLLCRLVSCPSLWERIRVSQCTSFSGSCSPGSG